MATGFCVDRWFSLGQRVYNRTCDNEFLCGQGFPCGQRVSMWVGGFQDDREYPSGQWVSIRTGGFQVDRGVPLGQVVSKWTGGFQEDSGFPR